MKFNYLTQEEKPKPRFNEIEPGTVFKLCGLENCRVYVKLNHDCPVVVNGVKCNTFCLTVNRVLHVGDYAPVFPYDAKLNLTPMT